MSHIGFVPPPPPPPTTVLQDHRELPKTRKAPAKHRTFRKECEVSTTSYGHWLQLWCALLLFCDTATLQDAAKDKGWKQRIEIVVHSSRNVPQSLPFVAFAGTLDYFRSCSWGSKLFEVDSRCVAHCFSFPYSTNNSSQTRAFKG